MGIVRGSFAYLRHSLKYLFVSLGVVALCMDALTKAVEYTSLGGENSLTTREEAAKRGYQTRVSRTPPKIQPWSTTFRRRYASTRLRGHYGLHQSNAVEI
jgi:hypothetical protein